jgi:hypothetical protein
MTHVHAAGETEGPYACSASLATQLLSTALKQWYGTPRSWLQPLPGPDRSYRRDHIKSFESKLSVQNTHLIEFAAATRSSGSSTPPAAATTRASTLSPMPCTRREQRPHMCWAYS